MVLASLAKHLAKLAVFVIAQAPIPHLIFRLSNAMGDVVFDDPDVNCISKHRACQADAFARRSTTAAQNRNTSLLASLFDSTRFPGNHVVHHLRHVGLGEVTHAALADQGDDVSVQSTDVRINRGRSLWASAFAHD